MTYGNILNYPIEKVNRYFVDFIPPLWYKINKIYPKPIEHTITSGEVFEKLVGITTPEMLSVPVSKYFPRKPSLQTEFSSDVNFA